MSKETEAKKPTPTKTQKAETPREVVPIVPAHFGLAKHKYGQFSAEVAPGTKREDLTKPDMWHHIARQVNAYDEIRVICQDGSFVAHLIVTFKHGTDLLLEIIDFTKMADVSYDLNEQFARFEVKQKGVLAWCVVDKKTGANVKERIPTQGAAVKLMEEHITILSR